MPDTQNRRHCTYTQPYSILISLNDRQLELITLHSQLKLKKPVKVVDVTTQAVTQEELPKVFKVLDTEPETAAIILKGHGIVAISSSAVKAGQIAELIEETAMIAWNRKTQKVKENRYDKLYHHTY